MMETVINNPWIRVLGILLLLSLVAALVYLLSPVLVPLFFAFIVAYIFDPVVDAIERRKLGRSWSVVVLILGLLIFVIGLPVIIIPGMVVEANHLIETATSDIGLGWLDNILDRLPLDVWLQQAGVEVSEDQSVRSALATLLGEQISTKAQAFMQAYGREVVSVGQKAGASAAEIFSAISAWVMNSVLLIGNLVLFAFVAIYLLKDYDDIIAAAYELIPPKYRAKTLKIMGDIDLQLKAYLRGQVAVCVCLGFMYGLGMKICGTPFAIPLALFGAVASFVPYLGVILTIGPAVLLTLLKFGVGWEVVGVLATFAIAQTLEGNFLTPKIVGSQVGLNPVWVILAIMVFSMALGFLGLLLAVPIAAVLKVLIGEGLVYYKNSPVFKEAAATGGDNSS